MSEIKIDLELPSGSFQSSLPSCGISVVFGASGAGKTRLLRAIAGLDRHRGEIIFNGTIWCDKKFSLSPFQRGVNMAFQEPRLLIHKNVAQNIALGEAAPLPKTECDALLNILGITALVDKKPNQLSGGEQQRVALARALTKSGSLLLLDEPFTGLDNRRKTALMQWLRDYSLHTPILLVTHQLDEVLALAQHLVLLSEQGDCATGAVDSLLNHPLLVTQRGHHVSVIRGEVTGVDAHGLASLSLSAQQVLFLLSSQALQPQQILHVAIDARDVSLSISAATDSSILNILAVEIQELRATADGAVLATLALAGQPLRALLSQRSATQLQLQPGMKVFAQIKGTATLA